MKKMATDNYNWGWIFWTSCAVIRKSFPGWKTWRERGWLVGSRGILRDATLRLRREGSSKTRTLDCALATTGVSETKRVRSAGPTSFLSLRRSSALPARGMQILTAALFILPNSRSRPFSEFCRQLVFFLPVLSSLATMRWRWLCWWCDSEGENSQSKLNMKCNTTAGLTWKILFLYRTTVFRDIYVTQYFR